jgi:hypothetical protein
MSINEGLDAFSRAKTKSSLPVGSKMAAIWKESISYVLMLFNNICNYTNNTFIIL